MKLKLLFFLLCCSTANYAQNAADVDLVIGTGFVSYSNVQKIAIQADEKIIVGGFLDISGQGEYWQLRLARFDSDGSLDSSFQVSIFANSGYVNDIKIQPDGKILVAGNFTSSNGVYIPKLLRLNPDGTKDDSFLFAGGIVNSIALQPDGKIVVAGNLSFYINEHLQRNIVRLNTDGTVDSTFDFGFEGFPMIASTVNKVVVQPDGKIVAGGHFSVFNNEPQGSLIRFNADGTKDTSFIIGTGITTSTLIADIALQSDGKILIAGGFESWSGQPFGRLCRLNTDGSLDDSFVLGIGGSHISGIALQDNGKIIALGGIIVNGIQPRVVRINIDGSLDLNFDISGANNAVSCVALQTDGKILIGGYMNEVQGVSKNCFARINTDGSIDSTFISSTGLNGKVTTIGLQSDGKTILAGDFTKFDGITQHKIIRLESDGIKDTSFNIGSGFNNSIRIIIVQPDGKILVGGNFTVFNTTTANSLVRLHSDGTIDDTFTIGFNASVNTMVLQPDGKIVVGGDFTLFNGQTQNYCIRLNSNGTKDNSFGNETTFNGSITKLALQTDGKIMVGGDFTTFNGEDQNRLIRLHLDGTKDNTFQIGTGFTTFIRAIEILENGKMYIAATMPSYNGSYLSMPIRLNADGSVDSSFTQGAVINDTSSVDAIAVQVDGKVIVGGSFRYVNNLNQSPKRIMRLNADGTLDASFIENVTMPGQGSGFLEGACLAIAIQTDGKIWLGGSFFNYKNTASFSAIRLKGDSFLSTDNPVSILNKTLLYPNPVHNMLYLSDEVQSIKIADVSGKIVALIQKTNQVDFSTFAAGLYLLTIENENGLIETRKIVKQ